MSSMEAHKGEAFATGTTVPEFLAAYPHLIDGNYKDQVESDPYEVFYSGLTCGYESFVEVDNQVYKLNNTQLDEYGYAVADRTDYGSFKYNVMFYNGGCSLQEAIQQAIKECGN